MKRWTLSIDGGVTFPTVVTPLGGSFTKERDLDSGLIAFRTKLSSDLLFIKDDFTLFRAYEQSDENRCLRLFIRRERYCSGEWQVQWTGRFSTGSGRWNFNTCQFSVKPDVVDQYTCILDKLKVKVNALDVPAQEVEGVIFPSNVEFLICNGSGPSSECAEAQVGNNGWAGVIWAEAVCGGAVTFYWREKVTTNCVDGAPVPPPGAGWVLLADNCASDGTAIYVRPPSDPFPFDDPTVVITGSEDPTPPGGPCSNWFHMGTIECDPLAPTWAHVWLCPDTGDVTTYDRGRKLIDVLNYMFSKTDCPQLDIVNIVSDFFEWTPPGDAPGYVAGQNYVTGETNQVDKLFIFQKSDVVLPGASNPAVRGETTMAEVLSWMRTMFRVYWRLTDDGDMRFEHWLYWAAVEGLDLTDTAEKRKLAGLNAYTHLKDEIPARERLTFQEALGSDFVGVPIEYSGPCVTEDGDQSELEYTLKGLTTDIVFIDSDPDAIDRTGFVMMATSEVSGVFTVIIDIGAITGAPATNAPLSTANLQDKYWRWDRLQPTGNMNGTDVTFDGYLPTIEQTGVLVRMCCDMMDWVPENTVKTLLGENYLGGRQGFVQKAEIKDATDLMTLTLRYGY